MKKITINLHPLGEKKENKILKTAVKYIPFAFMGGIILAAINLLLFIIVSFMVVSNKSLDLKLKSLSSQLNEVNSLKKDLESLTTERKEYSQPLTKNISLSRVFADIFESLPKNIWIDAIKFDGQNINLAGYVVEWKENPFASVEKFIKNLSGKEYFSTVFKNINPPVYRAATRANVGIGEFKIECKK